MMQTPLPKLINQSASAKALVGIWTILLAVFIIGALFVARDILIPMALAALLTFLLTPLVTVLERWLGRICSVLLVVLLILAAAAGGGWMLTSQLVDLAAKLPDYQNNIQAKLKAFKVPSGGRFTKFSAAVKELKKDLPGAAPVEVIEPPNESMTASSGDLEIKPASPAPVAEAPASNPFRVLHVIVAPLLGPLGTAALVLLLVIFMLLRREDLRNRLIRLIGQGRISSTTRAMDDAGARVRRYLLMQLLLNVGYGICVAIGLHFIGVPNAILWGAFSAVLRFIPYVGPWIGAAVPIALSLAVSPSWMMPLLTLGLFVTLELLSNNFMEPWLYGSSTGVTPIALIFAALFWTWLWGPVGLVLATPMTVCLVVMGRHIPRLSFLSILLSDSEALTPAEDCYYRLLTVGEQDEMELVDTYLKTNSLATLYDSVLIPVLSAAQVDHRLQLLDDEQRAHVELSLRDIIEELSARPPGSLNSGVETAPTAEVTGARRVYCIPARADRDEVAGEMFMHLLKQEGYEAQSAPAKIEVVDLLQLVQGAEAEVVCISVVAPSTVLHARYLCLKLRAFLPDQKILVGLWGSAGSITNASQRVRESGADEVASTFAEALQYLNNMQVNSPLTGASGLMSETENFEPVVSVPAALV